MVCHMGGFPTIRHNEIRDLTASLLTEVCHNVAAEPHLQPLNGETMAFAQPSQMMGPDLTSEQGASGMLHRMHFLT